MVGGNAPGPRSWRCNDPGFARQQCCDVVLFPLILQSCFELRSPSLDLITQQTLGSMMALATKPQSMAWHRVGGLMFEFLFGVVRSMRGNHKELSLVDTLAACERAVWGAATRATHGWGVHKGYSAGVLDARRPGPRRRMKSCPSQIQPLSASL